MLKTLYRCRFSILLILLLAFHAINNYIWISLDTDATVFDSVHHSELVVRLHNLLEYLKTPGLDLMLKKEKLLIFLNHVRFGWSPFIHAMAAWSYLIFPLHPDIFFHMRFLNMFYLFILLTFTYLIGKKIHSPLAGFLAALCLSLYPAIFGFSRHFGLDFPLTAIVSLLFYLFLSTHNFSKPAPSILFGVILGVGLLIKLKCAIFLLSPIVYVLLFATKENKRSLYRNASFAIATAWLIGLLWWHKIFSAFGFAEILRHIFSRDINSAYCGEYFLGDLTFYLKKIFQLTSPIFFALLCFSLIFFIKKILEKNSYFSKNYSLIASWLIVPYFIFSLFQTKNFRYILPAYGAIGLISAIGWLESPLQKNIKKILAAILIVFGFLQFFEISYGYPILGILTSQRSPWTRKPTYNNHKQIAEQFELTMLFNRMMEKQNNKTNLIGIIEEKFFRGDKCIKLGNYLLAANNKNDIILSADGTRPYYLREQFLTRYSNIDFLIAFSTVDSWPDFLSLKAVPPVFSHDPLRFDLDAMVRGFRAYRIVDFATLYPENIRVFLLKKDTPLSVPALLSQRDHPERSINPVMNFTHR